MKSQSQRQGRGGLVPPHPPPTPLPKRETLVDFWQLQARLESVTSLAQSGLLLLPPPLRPQFPRSWGSPGCGKRGRRTGLTPDDPDQGWLAFFSYPRHPTGGSLTSLSSLATSFRSPRTNSKSSTIILICSFTLALEAGGTPSAGEDTDEEVAEEEDVVPLDLADILWGSAGRRGREGKDGRQVRRADLARAMDDTAGPRPSFELRSCCCCCSRCLCSACTSWAPVPGALRSRRAPALPSTALSEGAPAAGRRADGRALRLRWSPFPPPPHPSTPHTDMQTRRALRSPRAPERGVQAGERASAGGPRGYSPSPRHMVR